MKMPGQVCTIGPQSKRVHFLWSSLIALTIFALSLMTFAAQDASGGPEPKGELAAFISRGMSASLSPRGSLSYDITKKTASMQFNTGVSPVVLVKLPEVTEPYTIRITCRATGMFKLNVVVPIVMFFDPEYNNTRTVGESAFSLKYPTNTKRLRVEGEIVVSQENRHDRFLLVYTDSSKIGKTFGYLNSDVNIVGTAPIHTSYSVYRATEGKLRLEVVK